jgi:hypothetical protein
MSFLFAYPVKSFFFQGSVDFAKLKENFQKNFVVITP